MRAQSFAPYHRLHNKMKVVNVDFFKNNCSDVVAFCFVVVCVFVCLFVVVVVVCFCIALVYIVLNQAWVSTKESGRDG